MGKHHFSDLQGAASAPDVETREAGICRDCSRLKFASNGTCQGSLESSRRELSVDMPRRNPRGAEAETIEDGEERIDDEREQGRELLISDFLSFHEKCTYFVYIEYEKQDICLFIYSFIHLFIYIGICPISTVLLRPIGFDPPDPSFYSVRSDSIRPIHRSAPSDRIHLALSVVLISPIDSIFAQSIVLLHPIDSICPIRSV
jgi:hypothetical protein